MRTLSRHRLFRKNHTFYIRVSIPRSLFLVAFKKEFVYSLHTADYGRAMQLYANESSFIDKCIDFLKVAKMRVSKSSTNTNPMITIEETDIDNVLLHRLEEIMKYINSYYTEIKNFETGFEKISLANKFYDLDCSNNKAIIGARYFLNYLKWWRNQPALDVKIKNIINKVFQNQTNLPINPESYKAVEQDNWFADYIRKLNQLENYYSQYISDIQRNTPDSYREITPPLINKLISAYETNETQKILKKKKLKTLWQTLYKDFELKKLTSGTREITVREYKTKLAMMFEMMGRRTVEDITPADLKKISYDIHCIPKNWCRTTKKSIRRVEYLEKGAEGTLSSKSIKGYLCLLADFLNFAYQNDVLDVSLNKYITLPKINQEIKRDAFDEEELLNIFNPRTYPSRYSDKDFPKFWVPLIALYSGARGNEICQLRVEDVIKRDNVWCFNIGAHEKTLSVKNAQSQRIIPIHPVLIELGFVDWVNKLKELKVKQIFHILNYTERNLYGGAVLKWFARYLDQIGIVSKKKVFHSFRHTFETKCVEKKLTAEVQNQICGWLNKGVGQRLYSKGMDVKGLYKEIKKIQYPYLRECLPNYLHNESKRDFSLEMPKPPASKPRKSRKLKLTPRV